MTSLQKAKKPRSQEGKKARKQKSKKARRQGNRQEADNTEVEPREVDESTEQSCTYSQEWTHAISVKPSFWENNPRPYWRSLKKNAREQ